VADEDEVAGRRSSRVALLLGVLLLIGVVASCSSDDQGRPLGRGSTDASRARSELASKLPGADSVGEGYRVRANSFTEPPEPFDPAMTTTTTAQRYNTLDKFCPGARWPALDAHPDVAGVEYVRFVGEDEREVTVGLAPLPPSLDRAGMTELRQAINDCGTIRDDQGSAVSITTLSADDETDAGDYGIDIRSSVEVTAAGDEGGSIGGPSGPLSKRTYLFVVDDTLVSVVAENGFDLDQLGTVSGDDDLVPTVAQATADRLES